MDHPHRRMPFTPLPINDTDATAEPTRPDPSSAVATPSAPVPDKTPSLPHHLYTLTVEDVAVKLADQNLYRDPRTIQRWCKTGRLTCVLNQTNGEKYLIEPSSVADMIATLAAEVERQSRPQADMSRSPSRRAETHRDTDTTREPEPLADNDDATVDDATEKPTRRDESQNGRDDAATLEKRINELEAELAITKADKQVREGMVEYMKEQFEKMAEGALDRAEQVGQLRAENEQLRNLLGDVSSTGGDNGQHETGV